MSSLNVKLPRVDEFLELTRGLLMDDLFYLPE